MPRASTTKTAFVAVNRFRLDDLRPYVYITHDGGATWQLAVNGLPNQPVNAVRQDPVEPRLLYAATENGVCVSFDFGARWQSLQLDLPHTSVRDLIVHEGDAVVATHGRGFWILDDIEPLRELSRGAVHGNRTFSRRRSTYRVRRSTNTDTPLPPEEPTGENPADGRDRRLRAGLGGAARRHLDLRFRRTQVRRYASDDPPQRSIPNLDKPAYWEAPFVRPATTVGMHRFVWDLREPSPRSVGGEDLPISAVPHDTPRAPEGPLVVPGRYMVRLQVDGTTLEHSLEIVMDPRVRISSAALEQQYRLARGLAALMDRSYAESAAAKAAGNATAQAKSERINAEAGMLLDTIDGADAPPTAQAVEAVRALAGSKASIP